MPRKSKSTPKPLNLGKETLGKRIARLRKSRGWTQTQLADEISINQSVVAAHEQDRLRMDWEMFIRYSKALDVTLDEFSGLKKTVISDKQMLPARLLRQFKKIEDMPIKEQKILLKIIHAYIDGINEVNQ